MKIAFYIPNLNGGGAERVLVTLLQELSKEKNLSIDLILNKRTGTYLNDVPTLIRILETKSKKIHFDFFKIRKYLKTEKPDFLISEMTLQNLIAIIAKKTLPACKTKIIIHEHCSLEAGLKIKATRMSFYLRLARFFYPFADQLVTASKAMADEFHTCHNIPRRKIKTIYNPFNIEAIQKKAEETLIHPWLRQNREEKVLVASGRLDPQKDYPTLLKAFAELIKEKPAHLIIMGKGEDESKLKQLASSLGIEKKIDFVGFVQNPFPYIRKADVFVLSSKFEGLPSVVIEALAVGTPVAATDCPTGTAEILLHGKVGKLVPVEDYKTLAKAILNFLDTPPEKSMLIQRAKNFDAKKIASEWLTLLQMN